MNDLKGEILKDKDGKLYVSIIKEKRVEQPIIKESKPKIKKSRKKVK